ncbi:MAG: isoprenylcysteine carboxylmethyltransferase family protein [Chloroflexi bacterium]|nr:isoprenylcysteine carboxylmethyltransferase family protein [Chloroflexota bacterium]
MIKTQEGYPIKSKDSIGAGKIIYTAIWILIWPVLLLLLSGDWLWVEGWIFNIWLLLLCFFTISYLYRKDPALLAERFKQPGTANQEGWDRFVVYGLGLGFIAWILIMPLDAKRLAWNVSFPIWLKVLGGIGLILSSFFFYRSYTENTFASPLVRIQAERKQHVISTGVYSIVRHPMYLAGLLMFLGAPLLLGSIYGLLVGSLMSLLLVVRITGEEKMLIAELVGYIDYKKKVRYRLIPFIW